LSRFLRQSRPLCEARKGQRCRLVLAGRRICSDAKAARQGGCRKVWWGDMRRIVQLAFAGVLAASTAQAADMPVKAAAPVPYVQGPWLELFGGLSVAPHSVFGYAGGVYAFNRNLNRDGWLFRVAGGDGHYEYNRAVGLSQGVDFQAGTVSVGYQAFLGTTRISGYVGADVEHHDNSDPLAAIAGTKWGVKGQGEIYAPIGSAAYAYVLGTISSVWSNYLVLGKLGYNITNTISVGPEVMALGNERFDAVRVGPFISISLMQNIDLIVSGGYSWDSRRNTLNDDSGGFANLHLRAVF
jgi:hypothetical protein